MDHEALGIVLRNLLTAAWLLPLAGFVIEIYALQAKWSHRLSKAPAYVAIACIGLGFLFSFSALICWGCNTNWAALADTDHHASGGHGGGHDADHHDPAKHDHGEGHDTKPAAGHMRVADQPAPADQPANAAEPVEAQVIEVAADGPEMVQGNGNGHHAASGPKFYAGTFYRLATFGSLNVTLDWYIDSLTLLMFTMVTFIATCIHIFATGYMAEELTEEYVDHEVHTRDGHHLHRPGRFHRFFAFLSLFCFSMLGLVLAGNIFQVFVFWELVGVCSYLLIGFYTERVSASTAANKAFIMNRVGDFGFLIGLMILWTSFGTFRFFDDSSSGQEQLGLFTMLRADDGLVDTSDDNKQIFLRNSHGDQLLEPLSGAPRTISYMLMVTAGLGIFAGCIGKSAQFPLQTWLPDAMEGPTPVSALVHSATMVAAGVYLAGRFYPMFLPEVLLAIAYIGCITLFIAATIAIVATDIKRVLAYSTISQLGYMMLGIGVAGWGAGLFHLITHAFFKSLLFLCSGSVIAGCHHVQEMTRMGGLRRKMPITAYTMLIACIAIAGLAIPGVIAFSGYHSKDAIVASALAYAQANSIHSLLFITPLVTAGITAFYMFRLWFMTFVGKPKDHHVYDEAHENPAVMTGPLIALSILAAFCAVGGESGVLYRLIAYSEPLGGDQTLVHHGAVNLNLPSHHDVHAVHGTAGRLALIAAFSGTIVAFLLYARPVLNPDQVRRQCQGLYDFLVQKWRFDVLYDAMFVRPILVISKWPAQFDKVVLDGILHGAARVTLSVAHWDRKFDETMVDGLVNLVGNATFSVGESLRVVQTGRLRQYVMFIAVGVVVLFVAVFTVLPK